MIHLCDDQAMEEPGAGTVYLPVSFCGLKVYNTDFLWTYYDCRHASTYVEMDQYCLECTDHPRVQLDLLAEAEL